MSLLSALVVANLRQSGDPQMLRLADQIETDEINALVDEETRRLEARPIYDKVADGDLSGIKPQLREKLFRWGVSSRKEI